MRDNSSVLKLLLFTESAHSTLSYGENTFESRLNLDFQSIHKILINIPKSISGNTPGLLQHSEPSNYLDTQ
jgi:hypothetical protein